ncbi:MAG: hypothetical protein ACK5KU_07695 [Beutenbergiaceae bacterium]
MWELVAVIGAVLAVMALVLIHLARRLDRLHRKVVRLRSVLDAQLVRRAEAAAQLAATGALDPASSVIVADAAWDAAVRAPRLVGIEADDLSDAGVERGLSESALSAVLRGALGSEADREQLRGRAEVAAELDALAKASFRSHLARRFHNDAVVAAQRLRRNRLVRLFRLAGNAAMPVTIELDDDV